MPHAAHAGEFPMSLWLIHWLPAIVIFIYLAVVLYIGIFAFRRLIPT